MATTSSLSVFGFKLKLCLALLACVIGATSAELNTTQLNTTFYDKTCPGALDVIKKAVKEAVKNESRMGASLLRLHFHDCFVQASLVSLPPSYISCLNTFKIMH